MRLKQSNSDRKSVAKVQLLESTCIFRFPIKSVDGDMAQIRVSSSDSSDKKAVLSELETLRGR